MHEMNTPVSVITLNAQTLELQTGKNPHLDTIKASVKILASIYDDLGYLVRKEHHDYPVEWINLLQFVGGRIAYFHEVAEVKNIMLELELDLEYKIKINPTELERLVDNTLSNAIKYSGENTFIQIFIGMENNEYVLSFKDEGIGMENTDIIFEHCYQGSSQNSGLGIGMATVKEICDKYKIKVQVDSTKGTGSTFLYYFDEKMVERV